MVDCQLHGLQPRGPHFTNLILHATAAILLFLALRALTNSIGISVFVATVFAVHPLRVEPVAWISARNDLLTGVFFGLVLLAYARHVTQAQRSARATGAYVRLIFLFALGLCASRALWLFRLSCYC